MPSGLFKRDESQNRWILKGDLPAVANGYNGDHVQLLVRYMFQFTPEELSRLRASAGAGAGR